MADHFDDQLAAGPALAMAAEATTKLRLGTIVYCNDYRHPVVLAKEAATLDLLTEGRFEFGLGAGWMTSDYASSGIELEAAGRRIDKMLESLEICRRLFGDGPVDFSGVHYQISGLSGGPRPHLPGGPPVFIGGGGPRMLREAGRHADIVGVNFNLNPGVISAELGPDATPERADEKISWVKAGAGDRWNDIEIQVRIHLATVTDDRMSMAEMLAPAFGLTTEQALGSPFALVGTAQQIAEDLLARRERWAISYITVSADAMEQMGAVIELLDGR